MYDALTTLVVLTISVVYVAEGEHQTAFALRISYETDILLDDCSGLLKGFRPSKSPIRQRLGRGQPIRTSA